MKLRMQDLEIQKEFERLMKQDPDGLLKPEAVVQAAENPSHPLHNRFVWNDEEAAQLYRIQQARQIIASFEIKIPQLKVSVRALTSLDVDRATGGYRWTLDTLERPDLREELVRTALRELTYLQNKYKHIQELHDIWEKISERQSNLVKN